MNMIIRLIVIAGALGALSLSDKASGEMLNGTSCEVRVAPEQLFDCLSASLRSQSGPNVARLLSSAATYCQANFGEVTKKCVGLTIQRFASQGVQEAPRPVVPPQSAPANVCNPQIAAQVIERQNPGMAPAVKAQALQFLLEMYGCIARTPQRSPQTTTCLPLPGGGFSCTTE